MNFCFAIRPRRPSDAVFMTEPENTLGEPESDLFPPRTRRLFERLTIGFHLRQCASSGRPGREQVRRMNREISPEIWSRKFKKRAGSQRC